MFTSSTFHGDARRRVFDFYLRATWFPKVSRSRIEDLVCATLLDGFAGGPIFFPPETYFHVLLESAIFDENDQRERLVSSRSICGKHRQKIRCRDPDDFLSRLSLPVSLGNSAMEQDIDQSSFQLIFRGIQFICTYSHACTRACRIASFVRDTNGKTFLPGSVRVDVFS